MRIRLFVYAIGLAALAVGFGIRSLFGEGPYTLIALCALIVFAFVSGSLLIMSEKGKYEMHASSLPCLAFEFDRIHPLKE